MQVTYSTTIDFWAFRTKSVLLELKKRLSDMYLKQTGLKLAFFDTGSGWQGYDKKLLISANGTNLGIIAYGGENQRGWAYVGLNGTGCQWVGDINSAHLELSSLVSYELRRVDIALTLMDGSVGHETVLRAYKRGGFQTRGRPPKLNQILPGDPTDGRTIYIGSRERDKFFRAYEKGYELLKNAPEHLKRTIKELDGVPVENIYRLELELKPKTCPLPVDLIENRDQYFAGAYPFLKRLIDAKPIAMTIKREVEPQLNLEVALGNVMKQYGSTLFTALMAYQGDTKKLLSKIMNGSHNDKLLSSGVLLVDHSDDFVRSNE